MESVIQHLAKELVFAERRLENDKHSLRDHLFNAEGDKASIRYTLNYIAELKAALEHLKTESATTHSEAA